MFIMLLLSFIIMFYFTNIKNQAIMKYPFIEDCTAMPKADDAVFMQEAATIEYLSNTAQEKEG